MSDKQRRQAPHASSLDGLDVVQIFHSKAKQILFHKNKHNIQKDH